MRFLYNNRFVHRGKYRIVVPYFDHIRLYAKERWFDKLRAFPYMLVLSTIAHITITHHDCANIYI